MTSDATLEIGTQSIGRISPRLYGHFAEHLGRCCYGGLWVGEDEGKGNSAAPDGAPVIEGFRADVVEALKALPMTLLRWPGGCYADHYHWRDGIGPARQRRHTLGMSCGSRCRMTIPWARMNSCACRAPGSRALPGRQRWLGNGAGVQRLGGISEFGDRLRSDTRAGCERPPVAVGCPPVGRGQRELGLRRSLRSDSLRAPNTVASPAWPGTSILASSSSPSASRTKVPSPQAWTASGTGSSWRTSAGRST